MMVQLFILMRGFDLHPLYYEGFYRLGCTVCPSLAEWEVELLKRKGVKDLPLTYASSGAGEVRGRE